MKIEMKIYYLIQNQTVQLYLIFLWNYYEIMVLIKTSNRILEGKFKTFTN